MKGVIPVGRGEIGAPLPDGAETTGGAMAVGEAGAGAGVPATRPTAEFEVVNAT